MYINNKTKFTNIFTTVIRMNDYILYMSLSYRVVTLT